MMWPVAWEPTLVARAGVIDRCRRALVDEGTRLLTVTGRRGVGSSRVVRAIAESLALPTLAVDALRATSPDELEGRIGRALGMRSITHESLVSRLSDQRLVLVLDDVGAVDVAGAVVDDLQRRLEHLVVLAASAAPLGVADEFALRLTPLDVPAEDETDIAAITASPAVTLFLEQADRTASTFDPTEDDLRAIAAICRRLDGLPRAIVLAAARVRLLAPEAMLQEMSRVGTWQLVGLPVDEELERTIALLDQPTVEVLESLAVMAGGATLDALSAVAAIPIPDVFSALALLLDLSLIEADAQNARYWLRPSVADFVEERTQGQGQWQERRRRHRDHFASPDRAFPPAHPAPPDRSEAWLADHANRLRALAFTRDEGDANGALRLAVATTEGFIRRGEPAAARRLLRDVLDHSAESTSASCIRAHLWSGRLAAESDDDDAAACALDHLDVALRLARDRGDPLLLLEALNARCENHTLLAGGMALVEEAVDEGLRACEDAGIDLGRGVFQGWRALVLHARGDLAAAAAAIAEAIDFARSLGADQLLVGFGIIHWGLPAVARRHDIGAPTLHQLVDMAGAHGDLRSQGWALTILVHTALDDGNDRAAIDACLELLDLSRSSGQLPLGWQAIAATVRVAADHGRAEDAAVLAGSLERHRSTVSAGVPTHMVAAIDHAIDRTRTSLDAAAFDRARRRGQDLRHTDAVREAENVLRSIRVLVDEMGAPRPPELSPTSDVLATLTPRELEVLTLLVEGQSNKEIAATLGVRPKTVMHHCAVIYEKLDVKNRTQAAAIALRELTTPSGSE